MRDVCGREGGWVWGLVELQIDRVEAQSDMLEKKLEEGDIYTELRLQLRRGLGGFTDRWGSDRSDAADHGGGRY